MGKHSKLPARGTRDAVALPSAFDADELLRGWIARLERMIAGAERLVESGEAAPTVLREASGVARAIVALSGELRQREKQAARRYDHLEHADVLAYLRDTASDKERKSIARELEDIIRHHRRSGLA